MSAARVQHRCVSGPECPGGIWLRSRLPGSGPYDAGFLVADQARVEPQHDTGVVAGSFRLSKHLVSDDRVRERAADVEEVDAVVAAGVGQRAKVA